ncbi:hypothetical protein F511_23309 [Dorcoceras hygrometricum]|uniref:Uncharacterized protein n=1 Tax=Dorcoceras hygrometricum TaxID=472368 RepID=A0A2Z7AHA2_9LAMI|nr:hypothetical protein F511_23309 [Dorcoceras hygrometricum]
MTGRETPSSACTRRPDEINMDGNSSSRWPEQVRRGKAATAARGKHGDGVWLGEEGGGRESLQVLFIGRLGLGIVVSIPYLANIFQPFVPYLSNPRTLFGRELFGDFPSFPVVVLLVRGFYQSLRDFSQGRAAIPYSHLPAGIVATMRRVVNYHSSWARQQQVELFDASGNPGSTAGRGFNPAGGAPGDRKFKTFETNAVRTRGARLARWPKRTLYVSCACWPIEERRLARVVALRCPRSVATLVAGRCDDGRSNSARCRARRASHLRYAGRSWSAMMRDVAGGRLLLMRRWPRACRGGMRPCGARKILCGGAAGRPPLRRVSGDVVMAGLISSRV